MKVKTSILNGVALDWAVATAEGHKAELDDNEVVSWKVILSNAYRLVWQPSTNWSQAGAIIERELITLDYNPLNPNEGRPWIATTRSGAEEYGATPLIAAMRAYVSSVFGDDVDIPEDLL
jgi:hypothetical protein